MSSKKFSPLVATLALAISLVSVVLATQREDVALQARYADLAAFSDMSYSDGDIEAYRVENGLNMRRVHHLDSLEQAGWSQIEKKQTAETMAVVSLNPQSIPGELHIKDSGLDAHSYINESTKEIVIAFAGTKSLTDGATDAWNHAGVVPKQYQDALKYALFLKKKYGKEYGITLTGHSLGGAEATFVAQILNLPAVVYNPDYLGVWVENYRKYFKKPNVEQFVHEKEFAHKVSDRDEEMENYFTKKVTVNYALPQYPLLNEQAEALKQAFDAHSIDRMLTYLETPQIAVSAQRNDNIPSLFPHTLMTSMPVSTPMFSSRLGRNETNMSSLLPPNTPPSSGESPIRGYTVNPPSGDSRASGSAGVR